MTTMNQLTLGEIDGEAFFLCNFLTSHVNLNQADCTKLHRVALRRVEWLTVNPELLRAIFHQVTGISPAYMALVEYYTILVRSPLPSSSDDGEEAASCDICRVPYSESSESSPAERAVVLGCGHAIGERCLARWLFQLRDMSYTCPTCRQSIWISLDNGFLGLRHPNLLKMVGAPEEGQTMDDEHTRLLRIHARAFQVLQAIQTRVLRYQVVAEKSDMVNRNLLIDHTLPAMVMCCKPSASQTDDSPVLKDASGKVIYIAETDMQILWADGALPSKRDDRMSVVSTWHFESAVTRTRNRDGTIAAQVYRDILPELHESVENVRQVRQRETDFRSHSTAVSHDVEESQMRIARHEDSLAHIDASIPFLGMHYDEVIRAIRLYNDCQDPAAMRYFRTTVLENYNFFTNEANHTDENMGQMLLDCEALFEDIGRLQERLRNRVQVDTHSAGAAANSLQMANERMGQHCDTSIGRVTDVQIVRDWLRKEFRGERITDETTRAELDSALEKLREHTAAVRLRNPYLPEHVWEETINSVPVDLRVID